MKASANPVAMESWGVSVISTVGVAWMDSASFGAIDMVEDLVKEIGYIVGRESSKIGTRAALTKSGTRSLDGFVVLVDAAVRKGKGHRSSGIDTRRRKRACAPFSTSMIPLGGLHFRSGRSSR